MGPSGDWAERVTLEGVSMSWNRQKARSRCPSYTGGFFEGIGPSIAMEGIAIIGSDKISRRLFLQCCLTIICTLYAVTIFDILK
jgi:hypothetical protein